LIGCGGGSSSNNDAQVYTVSFYDSLLDLIGNIDRTSNGVGGIAGDVDNYYGSATILNNAAISLSVTGSYYVNRIVGYIYSGSPTISNNIALDNMFGGVDYDGATNSFSNYDDIDYRHGTDKDNGALKTDAPYKVLGWDFTTVWKIPNGGGYPILQWQSE
jgi:hypothetical protein